MEKKTKRTSIELLRDANRYFLPYLQVMQEIEYNDGEMTPELEKRYNEVLKQYSSSPDLKNEIVQKAGNIALVYKNTIEPEFNHAKKNKAQAELTRKRIDKKMQWLRAMAEQLLEATGDDEIKLNGKKVMYFSYKQVVELHNEQLIKAILIDYFNNGGDERTVTPLYYTELLHFIEDCVDVKWEVNFNREATDVKLKVNDEKALAFLTSSEVNLGDVYDIHTVEKRTLNIRKL